MFAKYQTITNMSKLSSDLYELLGVSSGTCGLVVKLRLDIPKALGLNPSESLSFYTECNYSYILGVRILKVNAGQF